MVFTFSNTLTKLTSPEGEMTATEENGQQTFSLKFNKNFRKQRMKTRTLRLHGHYTVGEMTPALESVTFGAWSCNYPAPPPTEPPTEVVEGDTCTNYVIDHERDWNDGQEGTLELPVSRTLDTWFVEVRLCTTNCSFVEGGRAIQI